MFSPILSLLCDKMDLCLLLLIFFSYLYGTCEGQLSSTCASGNYTAASNYSKSLTQLLSALNNASSYSLYTLTKSTSAPLAYGMYQCRGDVSLADCHFCVNSTILTAAQQKCPTSMGADVLLDFCHLVYGNSSSLFDGHNMQDFSVALCNTQKNNDTTFQSNVQTALQNVTRSAPDNSNFFASVHHGLAYALAQCDGYLSSSQCSTCLSTYFDVGSNCNYAQGAQVHYRGCFYRYEDYSFYKLDLSVPPSPSPVPLHSLPPTFPIPIPVSSPPYSTHKASLISTGAIAGVSVAAGIILLGLVICLLFYCRSKKDRVETTQGLGQGHDFKPLFSPTVVFSYEDLQKATQDFHPDNKLGEGGFGPVYKGRLVDHQEVAIKKLSTASHQGKHEFMNEVNIITSVQHRNLIKLYGCCVEGFEKLLVYEYLPNKSLDLFLFHGNEDGNSETVLNWRTRLSIVLGIARGLAYLHQDSQVRIIHRDIKPSNILLDNDLTPKIADFGLARLFSHDISHITTRAAGTLGYLSPEYAMRGQLTEKADVYSYGVLVLEIVSGRKNADYSLSQEKQRLLDWAWNCYCEGEQWQLVDPRMNNMSPPTPLEEVVRVIHVALLCVQPSPLDRPSMTTVIQHLSGQTEILEKPNMPPFFATPTAAATHSSQLTTLNNSEADSVDNSQSLKVSVPLTREDHHNFAPGSDPSSNSEVVAR